MKFIKISSTLISAVVLVGLFAFLQMASSQLFLALVPISQLGVDIILVLIALLLYPNVRQLTETILNHTLNKQAIWIKSQLTHLANEVKYITHLLRLQRVIVRRISEIFNLQTACLLSLDAAGEIYELSDCFGVTLREKKKFQFKVSGGFMVWMKMEKEPLYLSKLEQTERYQYLGREEKDKLSKLQASLCLPLVYAEQINGILFLGAKPKNKTYSDEEIRLLFDVVSQTAEAIENAATHRNLSSMQRTLSNNQNRLKAMETRYSELKKAHQTLLDYIKLGILVLKSGKNVVEINDEFKQALSIDVERRYQNFVVEKAEKVQKKGQ